MNTFCRVLALLLTVCWTSCGKPPSDSENQLVIGVMPKLVGIDYFNACERGALEAADQLGVTVKYDGPPTNDVTAQAQMVETWINRGYGAIAVAPNDPDRIAPALKKAMAKGISVLTYDADAATDARHLFVNQATYAEIGKALVEVMVEGIGEQGKYVILTGSLTAANQNYWIDEIEAYTRERYPQMQNLRETPLASEEDQALATQVTIDALKAHPDIEGIYAITSVALPGAAEALRKTGQAGSVFLTGLSTPRAMESYVAEGTVKKFVLWSPVDLGYLTVVAAKRHHEGWGDGATIDAGRLGTIQVVGDEVRLGPPLIFDAETIGKYDF